MYGVRNLLDLSPDVRRLAALPEVRQLVTPIIGGGAFAARAIFFDKVPGANWALGWHQDSVIAVAEQQDVPGFLAWGQKAGVWQVQPPPEILAAMVAVRIHLDDCGPDNGPLRVIPGSHRHGWLDNEISRWKETVGPVTCLARAGGAVVMCPLILHASSKAVSPNHRRVIHIEYASEELPGGLEWHRRISCEPVSAARRLHSKKRSTRQLTQAARRCHTRTGRIHRENSPASVGRQPDGALFCRSTRIRARAR